MSLKIFVTRTCDRQAKRVSVPDQALVEAVMRAEHGLIDANLSGFLIKQRVARQGQGRSGGFRAIIVYRKGDLAVLVPVYAKSEQANVSPKEFMALQEIAETFSLLSPFEIERFVTEGRWRPLHVLH